MWMLDRHKEIKKRILTEFPTKDSLESYIKANNKIPGSVVELLLLEQDINLKEIKTWLYDNVKMYKTERLTMSQALEIERLAHLKFFLKKDLYMEFYEVVTGKEKLTDFLKNSIIARFKTTYMTEEDLEEYYYYVNNLKIVER